jgi:hypothetical protein
MNVRTGWAPLTRGSSYTTAVSYKLQLTRHALCFGTCSPGSSTHMSSCPDRNKALLNLVLGNIQHERKMLKRVDARFERIDVLNFEGRGS